MTERCDRCEETLAPEALQQGWPIPAGTEYICPDCYGDEAFCSEGHILPAGVDHGDCAACE